MDPTIVQTAEETKNKIYLSVDSADIPDEDKNKIKVETDTAYNVLTSNLPWDQKIAQLTQLISDNGTITRDEFKQKLEAGIDMSNAMDGEASEEASQQVISSFLAKYDQLYGESH